MKTKIALFLSVIILTGGCDWIKDLAEVDIPTDLVLDIPVTVSGEKSANFSVSKDLKLADNEDIEPYLEKLRKIDLKSLQVTVIGLTLVQTINTMSLDVAGIGTLFTQTNITSTNNTFTPQVDGAKLTQAGEKLKNDRKLTLTISGTVSGPMAYNVHLVFAAEVKAGALD
ncbi:MAG: hypothetical protein JXN62_14450 [Bacteroidales bacterium]|nr:hypothetical protein [Bacteroidales bacterium]